MAFEEVVFVRQEGEFRMVLGITGVPKDFRQRHPNRISIEWTYTPGQNGFPERGDLQTIQKSEERAMAALHDLGAIFVGHYYGDGRLVSTFHSRVKLDSPLKVKSGLLRRETFELVNHHDPEWEYYTTMLEPNPVEYQLYRSHQLFATLAANGDVHTVVRPVDFGMSFPTDAARSAAIAEAEKLGYRTNSRSDEGWIFVELQKDTAIDRDSLARILEELLAVVERHGGGFDGWACPVVRKLPEHASENIWAEPVQGGN
jgi:hypothetical protein